MEKEMLVRLVSDGFVEAKGGKAKETYLKIIPAFESGELPLKSHYAFGTEETLPLTSRGDLIALRSAGAYGETMASGYNCRPLPGSAYSR